MPHQERAREHHKSVGNTTSTDSGTYVSNGYGKGYPPKFFTVAQTDTDNDSETNQLHIPFLGVRHASQNGPGVLLSHLQTGMQTQ